MLETIMKNGSRPFLKWAGGKYQLLRHLLPHLSDGHTLLEPFVGAGAIFLNTNFKKYRLNDANADLIHVYQTLQQHGQAFIDECLSLFKTKTNQANFYYAAREKFNSLSQTPEKAALFIYLNRHGYNGLCRYNSSGGYNVPFGQYKKPFLPVEAMVFFAEKSARATFTCEHFAKVMKRASKKTIVYCDPPYVPLSKTAYFAHYSPLQFTNDDQWQLATAAKQLESKGCKVVLSNHDTKLTRSMYQGAAIQSISVARHISCNIHNRKPVKELIAVFSPRNDK